MSNESLFSLYNVPLNESPLYWTSMKARQMCCWVQIWMCTNIIFSLGELHNFFLIIIYNKPKCKKMTSKMKNKPLWWQLLHRNGTLRLFGRKPKKKTISSLLHFFFVFKKRFFFNWKRKLISKLIFLSWSVTYSTCILNWKNESLIFFLG